MTEITENTKIKAVAKKTPAKKRLTPIQEEGIKNMAKTIASGTDAIHEAEEREARLDVESMTLEHQERINKVVENNNYLDKNLDHSELVLFIGRLESYYDVIISELKAENKRLYQEHKVCRNGLNDAIDKVSS